MFTNQVALCICASISARNSFQSSDYGEENARIVWIARRLNVKSFRRILITDFTRNMKKDLMYNWRVAISPQSWFI